MHALIFQHSERLTTWKHWSVEQNRRPTNLSQLICQHSFASLYDGRLKHTYETLYRLIWASRRAPTPTVSWTRLRLGWSSAGQGTVQVKVIHESEVVSLGIAVQSQWLFCGEHQSLGNWQPVQDYEERCDMPSLQLIKDSCCRGPCWKAFQESIRIVQSG